MKQMTRYHWAILIAVVLSAINGYLTQEDLQTRDFFYDK